MLDLLLAVKGVRSIKFWSICPLEHLLTRLEFDKPFICRRIVKLLFNSYFPPDQGDEVKLERCIHLVQTNRAASRRFYHYSGEMLASASYGGQPRQLQDLGQGQDGGGRSRRLRGRTRMLWMVRLDPPYYVLVK